MYGRKSIVRSQVLENEILMDLHFLRSPESENQILRGLSLRVCVRGSVISMTQKQTITKIQS